METPQICLSQFLRERPCYVCPCGIDECPRPPGSRARYRLPGCVWRLNIDACAATQVLCERRNDLALLRNTQSLGSRTLGDCRLSLRIFRSGCIMGSMVCARDPAASLLPRAHHFDRRSVLRLHATGRGTNDLFVGHLRSRAQLGRKRADFFLRPAIFGRAGASAAVP
jgi:hypothetical protein